MPTSCLGSSGTLPGRGDERGEALELGFEPAWAGGLNIIPWARRAELVPLLVLPLRRDEVVEDVGEGGRGGAVIGASELLITLRSVVRGASTAGADGGGLTGGGVVGAGFIL